MDCGVLSGSPIGRLVPVSGTDWRTGRAYEYLAYVPEPLPELVALSDATWTAVEEAHEKLARLDGVAHRLSRGAIPRDRVRALAVPGATAARASEWASGRPLTADLVHGLQAVLVHGARGDGNDAGVLRHGNVFLGDQNGPIEGSRFVPPPHGSYLSEAFEGWIQWINRTDVCLAPVVQAGLAHYQFEALHPYSDGNGRVGRLAIVLTLMRRGVLRSPVLEIEAWIAGHRSEYQDRLLELSRTGEPDPWLTFFARAIAGSAEATERRLATLLGQPVPTRPPSRSMRVGGATDGRRRSRDRRPASVAASVLAAVSLAACGGSSSKKATGLKGSSEVLASAISTAGKNPFTPAVGTDARGLKPPAAAASATGGPSAYVASLTGLYGGTRNYKSCDAGKLVAFLQHNPTKAAAWASTLGVSTGGISQYVSRLTPVLLRTDTRVTNHGYIDGVADPIQSVLEAGTAVFVNQYGEPVVKCYCGNPLTAPVLLSQPVYTGPLWANFTTINITIIKPSPTVINTYTLYDPNTGTEFKRSAGAGGHDGPYIGSGPASTGPAPGGTTPPAPASSGTSTSTSSSTTSQPSENPSISLSPNPVVAGATVTLSGNGFLPNKSLQITVNRPDGGTDRFSAASDAQGNVTYTFPNAGGSITGTYQVTVTDTDTNASASSSIQVSPASNGTTSSST